MSEWGIGPDGGYDYSLVMTPAMCLLVDFATCRAQYYNRDAVAPIIDWYNHCAGGAAGLFYALENKILLKRGRETVETHATLIHELGHYLDYQINPQTFHKKGKRECECRAWDQGEVLLITSSGLSGTPAEVEELYYANSSAYSNSDRDIGLERRPHDPRS